MSRKVKLVLVSGTREDEGEWETLPEEDFKELQAAVNRKNGTYPHASQRLYIVEEESYKTPSDLLRWYKWKNLEDAERFKEAKRKYSMI